MELIVNIFKNIFLMLHEMAPYLLLGFGAAGVLSVLVSKEQIENKLGSSNFTSCLKAVLYGIPLPLCSCGVIPVGVSLKQHGASRGSIVSFLTTTPQTGVDSLWVTYGMLGAPILIFKLIVALLSGLFAGVLTNLFDNKNQESDKSDCYEECCNAKKGGLIKRALTYGFRTLPRDIIEPLLVGLILAGFISLLAQNDLELFNGIKELPSIIKVLAIMALSIPLYVCATASIPLALLVASPEFLNSPGGAIALLIAGPATNASTITTCIKMLGKKSTIIYVASIFMFALISGVIADNLSFIIDSISKESSHIHLNNHDIPPIFSISSLYVFMLLGILGFCLLNKKKIKDSPSFQKILVNGMTCNHCEASVEKSLLQLKGVESVQASHVTGEVILTGSNYDIDEIQKKIEGLNYLIISGNRQQ